MAAIGQLKIVADKAEELAAILEYVNDPKAFVESVQADVKTVHGLTEEEKEKAAAARSLIGQHQAILDNIKAETAKHESFKAEISEREAALFKSQEAFTDAVSKNNAEHQSNVDALEEEKKLFAAQIEKENIRIKNADDGFKKQVELFKNDKSDLAAEKDRVSSIEKDALALKAKYEKKLAIIQSDIE